MDVATSTWILAGCSAFLVGMAKNGVPGLGILVVPLMAYAFPARDSVGILLPILITGDVMAILLYRRHAQWRALLGMMPYVLVGIIVAGLVLQRLDNSALRPVLGMLILLLLGLELIRLRVGWKDLPHHPAFVGGIGVSAGFATTIGNAAGPVMSLYFLGRGLPKHQFVGTAAWFFFVVNCSKVPLFAALDMITLRTLTFNALMIPLVAAGALIGYRLLPRISPELFRGLVLVLTAVAAAGLLIR